MAAVVTPWWASKTVQGAAWIVLAAVGGALVPMLSARSVDWWSLGATALAALLVALKRCFDSDVQGPLSVMNVNNKIGTGG